MAPAKVEKPRIRNTSGQYAARGVISARLLRKAYAPRATRMFSATGPVLQFDACGFAPENVDTINAVIRGVSVITGGLIARGHDLEVDDTTLSQMKLCAEEKGQVPVKVDHKSGAAAVCGFLTGFRVEGNKLKADWHLLQSHPQKDQILEVAQRMPRGVGLSAAFVSPDKPELSKSGRKAARCHDLLSVDYVTLPAANPNGMFAAKVDSHSDAMTPEQLSAALDAAISKALAPITAKLDAQASQLRLISEQPSLEDLSQMSDEQLAEYGLTVEDVQNAINEIEAQGDEAPTDETSEGTDANAQVPADAAATVAPAANTAAATAAPAATGAVGAALAALTKQVTELSARFKAEDEKKANAEVETLFAEIEQKVEALSQENKQLRDAFKSGGKAVSAGVSGGNVKNFSQGDNGKTEFENIVQFNVDEKKLPNAKAFEAARKENPDAYKAHLVAKGVIKA